MTGFNLPPGCNVSDIPGNRPEDAEWERIEEKFWNDDQNCTKALWEKFSKAKLDDALMDIVTKAITYGMELGRAEQQVIDAENKAYEKMEAEHGNKE